MRVGTPTTSLTRGARGQAAVGDPHGALWGDCRLVPARPRFPTLHGSGVNADAHGALSLRFRHHQIDTLFAPPGILCIRFYPLTAAVHVRVFSAASLTSR